MCWVVDAPDVVGMDESAALALRRKPRSSVMVAAGRVHDGHCAALVTAGHTGAAVVAAHAVFGMLEGVDRPALARGRADQARVGGAARRRRHRGMPVRIICCSSG